MLGVLLDAGVIILLVSLVNQGEQIDMLPAAMCGIGISLGYFACQALLGEALGLVLVQSECRLHEGRVDVLELRHFAELGR